MQRLARQRDRHLSAIVNGLKATYTDACGLARGKTNIHKSARIRAVKPKKLKAIWLQLQQLALGLNEKHLCVKVVPWQRFLFCDQGQCEASFWKRGRISTNPYKPWLAGLRAHSIPSKALIVPKFKTNKWEIWQLETSVFLPNRGSICP